MAVTTPLQHAETGPTPESAPPIEPTGAPIPGPPPIWPTVVGIIAIIIGAGGMLMYGFGLVSSVVMALLADVVQDGGLDEFNAVQFNMAREFLWWNLIGNSVGLALAVLLLVGAIGLVRRRPASVRRLNIWAISRLVWSIPSLIMAYVVMDRQFTGMGDAMQQAGAAPPPIVTAIFDMMPAFSIAFGALLAWSFPTFVLVWFRRARIRDDVASWRRPGP